MSEGAHPPVCDYEGSDYQQTFWEQGERAYEDRVEAIALRRLLPAGEGRLLEVGAGAGRNTVRYRGYGQIVLLDYSRTQLEQAQARLGAGERYLYVLADVYQLPFAPGVFEAATMIRVIHHLVDPPKGLRQVRTTLAAGGTFILEYANKQNLKAILRWALRRQAWSPWTRDPVEFAPLNFDFHPGAMKAWVHAAGFRVDRQLTVSHYRLPLLKRWVPLRVLVALDAAAQLTGNWWQLSPSVFLRAKATGGTEPAPEGAFWRCPVCGSYDLESGPNGLHCRSCGRVWELRDGIYDFKTPRHTS